jgi:hypothetical protein
MANLFAAKPTISTSILPNEPLVPSAAHIWLFREQVVQPDVEIGA